MADDDFDCDTDLCLTLGGRRRSNSGSMRRVKRAEKSLAGGEMQEMTMVYGGQVCVCDVTERQAREIICMAKREMEEMTGSSSRRDAPPPPPPPPSFTEPQLWNPGLSMKRSLQRFLEKRRTRVCDSVPHQPKKKDNLFDEVDSSSLS